MRSLSSVVAMPRMATTLPLPPSALAMYSAGILPNAVLSPATYASCALVSVRPRSTTVTYTPLALTWPRALVSAADSNGKMTNRVDLVHRDQVLQLVGLLRRAACRLHDDLQAGVGLFQVLLGLVWPSTRCRQ